KFLPVAAVLFFFFFICSVNKTYAQAEIMPWGNLSGIRIEGQLVNFKTSIRVIGKDGLHVRETRKEAQRPHFKREGNVGEVKTNIDSLFFTETVTDLSKGTISVKIQGSSLKDSVMKGVYFCLELPYDKYAQSSIKFKKAEEISFGDIKAGGHDEYLQPYYKQVTFKAGKDMFSISCAEPSTILIHKNTDSAKQSFQLLFPVHAGKVFKGEQFESTYTIQLSGNIDKTPITISVDTAAKGRAFAGFGGNFRLQNPKVDPEVIDYCLKNMRVAWGRVEMPWRNWQPDSALDPTDNADKGHLDAHVKESMEMAQRLSAMHIPVILTAWAPPAWAIIGKPNFRPVGGIWGNPLDRSKLNRTYKSIADYIVYLKNHYGVEVKFFSFNESDLGINIRQTGEEHADLIRNLGAYFVSRGLNTKLLLGDNSDATTFKFTDEAIADPRTYPYIGAVSFHSWRGWDTPTLQKWADIAKKLNIPLIVGEGSIDAAAYAYPAYFEEQSYALEEINLYMRLLSICQPLSILQWQLTADYSPLKGGGIYGDNGPLLPTQRFWNLKQLASTPEGVYHIAATCSNPAISCAVLGNASQNVYTIHMVNNAASRKVTIKGIPDKAKQFKVVVTDKTRAMAQVDVVKVINSEITFQIDADCYTTLTSE
ncbi:MAG: hypothetical protein ABI203_03195, partial [Mucilaginibacter sp.]